jgi:hypothetical protein
MARLALLGDDALRTGALTMSPDGSKVFVTGSSVGTTHSSDGSNFEYATVAYNAGTGAVVWTERYNGPASSSDDANAAAVSPDSTKVFVTGFGHRSTSGEDYATIAYGAT